MAVCALDIGVAGELAPVTEMDAGYLLQQLMEEFERPLYAYVRSFLKDVDETHDCVQETFVRAYDNLRDGRAVNRQWLYRVAHNCAMDEFRRRRKMRSDVDDLVERAEQDFVDEKMTVRQALNRLQPLDREVLYLFAVAGFRSEEIAALLGMKGPAVRQRLCRARDKFRMSYVRSSRN